MTRSSPTRALVASALLVLLGGVAGCVERESLPIGETCAFTSQCDYPLVCRLDRCRQECVDSRDCATGFVCLRDEQTGLGGCQVDDELNCLLPSDCPPLLVCRFAACTTECAGDEDCVAGATCELDGGVGACHEPVARLCIYNSDCPERMVCGPGQICYVECYDDRDCVAPRACDLASNRCVWAWDAGTP